MPSTPEKSNSVFFLAAGDLHIGSTENDRLRALFEGAARHTDAAFLAVPGDLTNAALPEQYVGLRELTSLLPYPFLRTMGNHDFHTGPDVAARARFCAAFGVESASYTRRFGPGTFVCLSTDGEIDGCSVDIRQRLAMLAIALANTEGPVIVFCHAPLSGTVGGAPGRECFLSDDPQFGLGASAEVREIIQKAGKPVVWFSGHTHTPLAAESLLYTEEAGTGRIHSVNLSCPYFTGRDFVQTEPLALYRCTLTPDALDVVIEDAESGVTILHRVLPL